MTASVKVARVARLCARVFVATAAAAWIGSPAMADSDLCVNAPLVAVPGTHIGTSIDATNDGSNRCDDCNSVDVWVKVIPPANYNLHVSLCTNTHWDTNLSVHTACPGTRNNQLGCTDDSCALQSEITVPVSAGSTYYVRVSGWCNSRGPYTMNLEYLPPNEPTFPGPDVIVGDIRNANWYPPMGSISAYAFGATSCNVGTADALWQQPTPFHPVVHQAMYRLMDGRMEQLGYSWIKHTFGTIDDGICGTCNGHLGQVLGVGCSDPYDASQNGHPALLGPTWQVNATTGVFPYPPANPPYNGNDTIVRRLQVSTTDIDPAQNPGAVYFAEVQYVTQDDAQAGNGLNNSTYRRITIPSTTAVPVLQGESFRRLPAIKAWKAADPGVTEVTVNYLEGSLTARFIVAAKATKLAADDWNYEYAVYNLNSHRSGQAFSIPVGNGTSTSSIGFHDIAYHSGDGNGSVNFDGADWTAANAGGQLTWSTQTFAQNQNANALRWGTTYNFRFRSNRPPTTGAGSITLFRPGAAGEPAAASVPGLPVPSAAPCPADVNNDGVVTSQDIFDFLAAFFANQLMADFNEDSIVSSQDIFDFLAAFFTPCV